MPGVKANFLGRGWGARQGDYQEGTVSRRRGVFISVTMLSHAASLQGEGNKVVKPSALNRERRIGRSA